MDGLPSLCPFSVSLRWRTQATHAMNVQQYPRTRRTPCGFKPRGLPRKARFWPPTVTRRSRPRRQTQPAAKSRTGKRAKRDARGACDGCVSGRDRGGLLAEPNITRDQYRGTLAVLFSCDSGICCPSILSPEPQPEMSAWRVPWMRGLDGLSRRLEGIQE